MEKGFHGPRSAGSPHGSPSWEAGRISTQRPLRVTLPPEPQEQLTRGVLLAPVFPERHLTMIPEEPSQIQLVFSP